MDGPTVAVDLLQSQLAAGVPDGDGPIFTSRHQQSPSWVQTDRVHLNLNVREQTCLYVFIKYVFNAAKMSQCLTNMNILFLRVFPTTTHAHSVTCLKTE